METKKSRLFGFKRLLCVIVLILSHAVVLASPLTPLTPTDIIEYWAPVVFQDVLYRDGGWLGKDMYVARDCLVAFNWDGDWLGANNWDNSAYQPGDSQEPPLYGKAYASFIETDPESEDGFYFLLYGYYHAAQDARSSLWRHQHDWESVIMAIRKDGSPYGQFEAMATHYHGDMLCYTEQDIAFAGHRPIIFIQSNGDFKGHGIQAYSSQTPGSNGVVYVPDIYSENVTSTALGTSNDWATAPAYGYKLVPLANLWGLRGNSDVYADYNLFQYDPNGESSGGNIPFNLSYFYNPRWWFHDKFPHLQGINTQPYVFNPYYNNVWGQAGPHNSNGILPDPAPWVHHNIGSGSAGQSWTYRGEMTLYHKTGGTASSTVDNLRFNRIYVSGDFLLSMWVYDVQDLPGMMAGLNIRNNTQAGSKNIFLYVTPDMRSHFSHRAEGNGPTIEGPSAPPTNPGVTKPVLLRIRREGDTFTARYSTNGTNFAKLAEVTLEMNDSLYIGAAVASGENSDTTMFGSATFLMD